MHYGITHRLAAVHVLVLAAIWLCGSGSSLAQTFPTLYLFGGGGSPRGTLVEGTDGNLYGTTYGSGGKNNGMIFKITPGGAFTTLYDFDSLGDYFPGRLVQASDGNFYGTTLEGGTNGHAMLFRITPSGAKTTIYNFCSQSGCADGTAPLG